MKNILRKSFIIIILSLALCVSTTSPAQAQSILQGDTIPSGTVLDQDVFLVGQDVSLAGTVNGNVFILGNQVSISGTVDGSLILIGQNVVISGSVTGATYATALTLELAPGAALGRDLYIATVSLTSGKESIIGRDLYAVGLDAGLSGQVGRNLHTVIGPIQLYNGFMTLLGFDELTLKLHIDTPQTPADGNSSGQRLPTLHLARMRIIPSNTAEVKAFNWGNWALSLLRSWTVLFIFGLLALWLARKPLKECGLPLQTRPWQVLGNGLLLLIIALNLFLVALLLVALIFGIGLGVNFLGLWQLSIAFWVAGYACLAFLMVALWFFLAYGTKVIVVYVVSTWLFAKISHRKAVWLDVLAILAGALVYVLLRAIPYAGWMINILVTAIGLGSGWLAWRARRQVVPPIALPVVPQPPVRKVRKPPTQEKSR